MAFIPTVLVTIADKYVFTKLAELSIKSSFEHLTDSCSLTIAKKYRDKNKTVVSGDGLFKVGDSIKVELGYDYQYNTAFEGYLTRIYPDEVLIRLEAQDGMYVLKKKPITISMEKFDLKQCIAKITEGTGITYVVNEDLKSDSFRLVNFTAAQVLEELRKLYGVYSFFRDSVLHVGRAYNEKLRKNHVLRFDLNIWPDPDLQYTQKEDVHIRIKDISMNGAHGKEKIEVLVPEIGEGEIRTFHKRNTDKATLKAFCEKELAKVRYDGWKGSFITYIVPYINHGDSIRFIDTRVPDRNNASYMVKAVERRLNVSEGLVQEVHMDGTKIQRNALLMVRRIRYIHYVEHS